MRNEVVEQLKLFSSQLTPYKIEFIALGFFYLNLNELSTFVFSVVMYVHNCVWTDEKLRIYKLVKISIYNIFTKLFLQCEYMSTRSAKKFIYLLFHVCVLYEKKINVIVTVRRSRIFMFWTLFRYSYNLIEGWPHLVLLTTSLSTL